MSDSEEDFLSADEGSDFEELPSSITEVADNSLASCQTQVDLCTKDPGDSQTTYTSISKISDSASLQTQVEHVINGSGASQTKNTLIFDAKQNEIKHEFNLHEVNTETNIINDSELERGLDENYEIKKNIVDSLNISDKIEEAVKIEGSPKKSIALAELSKQKDNIGLTDELYNIEMRNALPLEDKKSDGLEACVNKLDNSDHIITDEKKNTLKFTENTSEGKEDFQSNYVALSGIDSNMKNELQSANDVSIPKPIKTSKIGAKKTRGKLGEKMGTKKLGSKVAKKHQESVTFDNQKTIIESHEESHNLEYQLQEKQPGFTYEKKNMEEGRQEEENRKQEEWDEQQCRWQEVQGIKKTLKQSSQNQESEEIGWGSWGNWGSSLISAVGTLTHEVGRGVGTVIETVEEGLGVPDPETLAKELTENEQQSKEGRLKKSAIEKDSIEKDEKNNRNSDNTGQTFEESQIQNDITGSSQKGTDKGQEIEKIEYLCNESQGNFNLSSLTGLSTNSFGGFGLFVSGASKALETASNKVLLGGLDTLELIGQRAMDTIQKGDPGLKKKKAFLMDESPNLSHTLREARQCAASEDQQKLINPQMPTLYQAWDNTEGPVHMEALYLVAKQCQGKTSQLMHTLPPHSLTRLTNSNFDISTFCEISDENLLEEGDFFSLLGTIVEEKGLPIQIDKLKKAWADLESTSSLISVTGAVVGPSMECQLYTALAALLEQMAAVIHKGSELALITPDVAPHDVAQQFKRLTGLVCGSAEIMTDNVCSFITAEASSADPQINNIVTNIYLQVSEGNNYIQQCLKHLSIVLQYSNTKKFISGL